MKHTAVLAALLGLVAAAPTPTEELSGPNKIQKRAAITDACEIGYGSTNGGTTGGKGGTTTTVSAFAAFSSAAESDDAMVIVLKGAITESARIKVGSDKTIIGASGSSLTGVGLTIKDQSNVIVRNMKISKVLADTKSDAITVQASTNVWIDHCDVSSDMDHDKDYYDGLIDITHASEWVTVSNTYFHDHWKASLIGHSDNNADEDTGHLHVTYANNYWYNINSRGPSYRFGTGHIYNSYYDEMLDSAINTRMGAELLVESTVFENTDNCLESADSDDDGYATVNDVVLNGGTNTAPAGSMSSSSLPYTYTLLGSANVKSSVTSNAGQTLSF